MREKKSVKNTKRRGFNLVEAAIVLGVVGLVIGGIWVAAAAVQSNLRKSDMSKGLIQIVQNVRNLYYGQSPTGFSIITPQLIRAGAIPADFVNGTTARSPWNGQIHVLINGSEDFIIEISEVPRDACIELASRNTNISTGIGLRQLNVVGNDTDGVSIDTFPYSPTDAANDCAALNRLDFYYGLRG